MDLLVKTQLQVSCWSCGEHCAEQQNSNKPPSPPKDGGAKEAALYLQASQVTEFQCGDLSGLKPEGPDVNNSQGVGVGVGGRGVSLCLQVFLYLVLYSAGSNAPFPGTPLWDTEYMGHSL